MIHLVEQRSEAWHRLRLGKPTASEYAKLIPLKRGRNDGEWLTDKGRGLLYKLVCERLMDEHIEEQYVSAEMREGADNEAPAAEAFARTFRCDLDVVGFVDTLGGRTGCSPDRLIRGTPWCAEIKVPKPTTQVRYLIEGVGEDYEAQCQGQMWALEYERCYFWSWRPEPQLPVYTTIRHRDEYYIRHLKSWVERFCDRLDKATEQVRGRGLAVRLEDGELRLGEPGAVCHETAA